MTPSKVQHAFMLHQAGEMAQAEKLYQELLKEDPQNAALQHLLGISLGQQGRFEEALKPLQIALTLKPDVPSIYNSLGNVEKRLGHPEKAIFYYQQALLSPVASAAVHNNLGTLFHQKKNWDKASQCYKKAIEMQPDYIEAHYNFSLVLIEQHALLSSTILSLGTSTEAISHLEYVLQQDPNHTQARTHLAQLLLQQKKLDDVIAHCEHNLKIDAEDVETHHLLAVALTQKNYWEKAILHYQETLKLKPTHDEALHNLGALYVVQRKPELALACYLQLLKLQPSFDAYYNIGVIYLYQDRHEDCINYLNEALKLEPDAFNVHVNLGAVYLKKEQFEQAISHYQTALGMKPDDPELLYILAALSNKSGFNAAPKAYVENLFDQYAPYFDQHLTQYLNYHVPKLLLTAVQKEIVAVPNFQATLDLGCGTGLCGAAFRPFVEKITGVDLSDNMLQVAGNKKIYDVLQKIDIHEALKNADNLDLIIAGDVFGYVGDLTQIFYLAAAALKKSGLFVFTTEKTWSADFELQNNARFAHHKKYIEALALANHLEILCCETAVLRMQKEHAVEGLVWVLMR